MICPTLENFIDFDCIFDDQKYKNILLKFTKDIDEAANEIERKKIFNFFAENYTLIPGVWASEIIHQKEDKNEFHAILKRSFTHFYSQNVYESARLRCRDCYKSLHETTVFGKNFYYYPPTRGETPEEILTYPNSLFDLNYYCWYDEKSKRSIPQNLPQQYKKALTISTWLKENELNFKHKPSKKNSNYFEKWMNVLFKWEDQKFAFQTIEYKLALNFENRDFWKAYINVTKFINVKIMLNIFCRYTKLFLSDTEMKEKYNNESEKAKKGLNFNDLPDLEDYLFEKNCFKRECDFNVFKGSLQRQNYSIPEHFVYYVNCHSTSSIRLKLFKSCKALFFQNPTPICHRLIIKSTTKKPFRFSYQYLKIKNAENEWLFSNLFVTNSLKIEYPGNTTMLHSCIIPKLSKCYARFIDIQQQVITKKEFKFLVNPSKIEKFVFWGGGIINNDFNKGASINWDDILKQTLNAHDIRIHFHKKYEILATSALFTIKKNVKLNVFNIGYLNSIVDVYDFCNFIFKNGEPKARFVLRFTDNVPEIAVKEFDVAVYEFISDKMDNEFDFYSAIGYPEELKQNDFK